MGKITDALKKAAEERLSRIEKLENKEEVKYQFVARKTVDSKIDARIVSFYDPKSPVAEQYRMMRTNIQALNNKPPIKTLTITSSIHGEGKTITALNLAISMAHDLSKKRIVLVDGDLRRSRIHKYLGIKAENGLSDVLSDSYSLDDALLEVSGIDNLTVLPAGKVPNNPAELVSSPKMVSLVSALKSKFDYVIFDSPPIVPVTDAGLIGAQTDGVIMVIQASRTQKGVVKHGAGLLNQAQARLLGYILTNVEYHVPAYIYRYL